MRNRLLTEMALAIALATVLDLVSKSVPIPRLYHGGSLSLHMLPIFIIAFRHGWRVGTASAAGYGVVNFIMGPFIVHPIQVPLDYLVAFSVVGLAGLGTFRRSGATTPTPSLRIRIALWVIFANALRFTAHFVSGIVFWAENAPEGQAVWIYSLLYNGSYMMPETVVDILLLQLMLRRIFPYLR